MTANTELLTDIDRQLATLPPEALKLVAEFVGAISKQYAVPMKPAKLRRLNLREEPFIGLWSGRIDMEDSAEFVRTLRRQEWK